MNYLYEPSNICLTYGSIISFMYDKEGQEKVADIPDLGLNKDNLSILNRDDSNHLNFNGDGLNVLNRKSNPNLRKEGFSDILISREFLYSHGVFNEFCFFHQFRSEDELKYDFYNTLFLVLPKGEYDSMTKLRAYIKKLKKRILIDDNLEFDKKPRQQIDFFEKFKQELDTNQEYSIKILNSKDKYVNFNDSVQFMHIKSGKFLEFKKIIGSLRIHIQLTDTLSHNTIFRFIPAFNYQGENSAKVMINLILKIACGEKQVSTENEKFLSKMNQINKTLISNIDPASNNIEPKSRAVRLFTDLAFKAIKKVDEKYKSFEKKDVIRNSLRRIVNDEKTHEKIKNNFKLYINNSDISFKGFGKNIVPNEEQTIIAGNRTSNYWRILNFSTNFLEDNKYINSLDYFSIQNFEKNLYIQSLEKKDRKNEKYQQNNIIDNFESREEDSIEIDNQSNIENDIINRRKRTINNNKNNNTDSTIKLDYFYTQEFNNELNYDLIVKQFQENDYIEPLSIFKFEVVYRTGEYGLYGPNPTYTIDKLKDNSFVRLINVFTNKVLMIELKVSKEQEIEFKLKLVNNQDIKKKDYFNTVFIIEKIQDYEELLNDDENNASQGNNENNTNNDNSKNNKNKKKDKNVFINKDEYIKIRSKKYNGYLGIRLNNEKNERILVLTNSISDLTKFKLNFLDEIDKYELHFFEQLNSSFENIINYFKLEKDILDNSITFLSDSNYEKIQHILIELENRINNFPENNKVNISQKNKFDFMKAIEHFNVVTKLVDIFLVIWFHDCENLNYYEMEQK